MIKYTGKYAGQELPRRIICMLLAVTLMGMGTSICVFADLGTDPCSCMNLGISGKIGLSFGTWQAIMNIILLVIILFFDRSLIGLGTVGNMFMCGFSADFFGGIWRSLADPAAFGLPARLGLTLLGSALLLVACSVYMTSNLGMAPYDCVAFVVTNRTKIKYRWARIIQDAIALLIGFFTGASVGIGTVILVFGTGPLIPPCNKYISSKIVGIDKIRRDTAGI